MTSPEEKARLVIEANIKRTMDTMGCGRITAARIVRDVIAEQIAEAAVDSYTLPYEDVAMRYRMVRQIVRDSPVSTSAEVSTEVRGRHVHRHNNGTVCIDPERCPEAQYHSAKDTNVQLERELNKPQWNPTCI